MQNVKPKISYLQDLISKSKTTHFSWWTSGNQANKYSRIYRSYAYANFTIFVFTQNQLEVNKN